jgi:uncharacterized membrane protein/peptidoglycan hydrolase-like protein with peptidoglycan-binding domain
MVGVAQESHRRSLAKAISWRVLGSVDTFILSWVITGSPLAAGSIASAETVTKVVLYYLHERAWSVGRWGRKADAAEPAGQGSRIAVSRHAMAVPARRADTRSLGARRGRSALPVRRSTALATSAARLPLAPRAASAATSVVVPSNAVVIPHRRSPSGRPKVSLWLPAKVGVAGALCTYLALTFGPALFEQPAIQVPGSDLADTRPAQAEPEAPRVRLTEFRPDEVPAAQPAAAAPVPAEITTNSAPVQEPVTREADLTLPPQRPSSDLSAEAPQRNLMVAEQAEEVQRRLTRFGYLPAAPTGVWGAMSRQALRTFKAAHDLPEDDHWDPRTERALFGASVKPADSFVGIWGADANACSAQGNRKGLLPAVIDNQGALAGETFCAFKDRVKTNEGWTFTATCTNPRERWTTKVRLETNGNKLTWASQRGNQTYTRCERRLITADMTTSRNR